MNISENGKILIKNFEGLRLKSYRCSANKLTIGYGHTGSDVSENLTITKQHAEKLFDMDIAIHCNNVSKLVTVPLSQNEFDALVSFEFNVGYGNFANSTMLKLLNQNKKKEASEEFTKWIYVKGIKSKGLVNRRNKEKYYFSSI